MSYDPPDRFPYVSAIDNLNQRFRGNNNSPATITTPAAMPSSGLWMMVLLLVLLGVVAVTTRDRWQPLLMLPRGGDDPLREDLD